MTLRSRYFEHDVFLSTIKIEYCDIIEGVNRHGTGFIVDYQVSPAYPNARMKFLVSNKHVLNGGGNLSLRFHGRDPETKDASFSVGVIRDGCDLRLDYMEHPTADLACVNVSRYLREDAIFWRGIQVEHIKTNLDDVLPGCEAWFVGYPDGNLDGFHNLPILRIGNIASIPDFDYLGGPMFLIDAHVYPGSSGSPVFIVSEYGQASLVGVISDVLQQRADLRQYIGLGAVLKARLIHEMLNTQIEAYLNRTIDADDGRA